MTALSDVRYRRRGIVRLGRRILSTTGGAVGISLLILVALLTSLGPLLYSADPLELDMALSLEPPGPEAPFGTDRQGRDVLSRTIHGSRASLSVSFTAVALSLSVGGLLGMLAGYYTRWFGRFTMRLMDVVMSFPSILFAIGIVAILGPGVRNSALAIGIVYTPRFARVAHSTTLALTGLEYVEAARSVGASDARILWHHIGRNGITPLIVQATFSLATAIIAEATLGFLGLGVQPPQPSWGSMIRESIVFLEVAPWMAVAPSLAIMATILAFNLLGDAVRDILDPRLRR